MLPRRRPTAQLLTPAGWAGLVALVSVAAIVAVAASGLISPR